MFYIRDLPVDKAGLFLYSETEFGRKEVPCLSRFVNGRYRWVTAAVFILYITVLFYLVFMSDSYGRNNHEILRYQHMNLVPFKTINNYLNAWEVVNPSVIITNIYGNIFAFVPFGLLGPIVLNRFKGFFRVLFYSFLLSMAIEVVQGLLRVGVMDVDDVILNVIGGVLGYLIYLILLRPFMVRPEQR